MTLWWIPWWANLPCWLGTKLFPYFFFLPQNAFPTTVTQSNASLETLCSLPWDLMACIPQKSGMAGEYLWASLETVTQVLLCWPLKCFQCNLESVFRNTGQHTDEPQRKQNHLQVCPAVSQESDICFWTQFFFSQWKFSPQHVKQITSFRNTLHGFEFSWLSNFESQ